MINIEKYLSSLKATLLHLDNWQPMQLARAWAKTVPSAPGVYVLKEQSEIIYVGETGNLRQRMIDLMDTRHHTARRTIGHKLFSELKGYHSASSKKKFPPHVESLLNDHICTHLCIAYLVVSLGRKELEEMLIDEIEHPARLNKRSRRKQ